MGRQIRLERQSMGELPAMVLPALEGELPAMEPPALEGEPFIPKGELPAMELSAIEGEYGW